MINILYQLGSESERIEMSPILLLATALLFLYVCYSFVTGKPKNSPPGILRLPVWGSYWMLLWGNYTFPHETLRYYMKKYKSKIISCYLGDFFTVIVNDYPSTKEVLSRREFDGRLFSDIMKIRSFGKKLGIFFNDDLQWQEQRRFALRNMRDVGFGRRHEELEENFVEELMVLLDTIDNGPINQSEKSVVNKNLAYFPHVMYPTLGNMIWSVMSGERLERSDHDLLRKLCQDASNFQKGGDTTGGAVSITGFLRHFGNLFGWKDLIGGHFGMVDFIKRFIDEQGEIVIADKSRSGFIPTYLREMKESSDLGEKGYSIEQLLMVTVDFMFPPMTAVPSVITQCFKYVMHHPEVMKKVQAEIDHVVGRGRIPRWDDRKDLPYTEAVIRETMRIETLTPFGVTHRCTEKTTLMGYDIPENTIIITNLDAMHNDPDFWGDPEIFRPERFLNEQGKLGKDYSLPFGLGRRLCAGETLARFMIFTLFATLLQHYDFSLVEGEPSNLNDKIPGLITQPKSAWFRLDPRH